MLMHAILVLQRMISCKSLALNLYVKTTQVDENFVRGDLAYAATKEKFFWRKNIFNTEDAIVEEMSIKEIFDQLLDAFDKFITLEEAKQLAYEIEDDFEKGIAQARESLEYCRDIGAGKVKTTSAVLRDFVMNHPTYESDSIIKDLCLRDMRAFLVDIVTEKINPF